MINLYDQNNIKSNDNINFKAKQENKQSSGNGLDDKYLENSQEIEINPDGNPEWEKSEEKMQYLTSESITSFGSIPDEYDVFDKEPSKYSHQEQSESQRDIKSKKIKEYTVSKKTDNYTKMSKEQEYSIDKKELSPADFYQKENRVMQESDTEIKTSTSSGLNVKYTLNVPSMITHLKRKDNYLESLNTFLNENLRAISDLMEIKKEVSLDIKNLKKANEEEKKNIKREEKRGDDMEQSMARTLEENYCLQTQNENTIKFVERVRDMISEKYNQYEQEIENLYITKQDMKNKVALNFEANLGLRNMKYYKAGKVVKTERVTEKLTSNEYQLECLQKIMSNEKDRVDQRLAVVREKTRLLNQLINSEDK